MGEFLMTRLGRVPAGADHVEVGGWRFEVVDMDRQRVDKVLATLVGNVTRVPTSGRAL
jgi:putative hemolysin